MPNPVVAVAGLSAGTGLIAANKSAKATNRATDAQTAAAYAGIDEQQRQFDAVQKLMAPFVEGGSDAFTQLTNLAGVNGAANQAGMLDMIQNDPRLAYAEQSAEEAILANAAATGGLRGGNTQAALMEMRPALFSQAIDQTFSQLGGIASAGQAAASGQASAAQNLGANNASLLQQIGSAQAGGALGQAAAFNQGLGAIANAGGGIFGSVTAPAGAGMFDQWGF